MNQKIRRNIKLEYIFRFIGNFSLTEAIWVLYLAYKGLSLWQIGILEGIFHITSLISEVPSGAMADRLGRRKVIILSRVATAISGCIMLFATEMWQFAVGFVFTAWGFNLLSGSEEAMLYDSFLYLDEEKKYYKTNSQLEVVLEVAQGMATFIGGVLSEKSFSYCYVATLVITLLSLIPCFLFCEPELKKQEQKERISLKEHFVISFKVIHDNPQVKQIILFYSLVFTFYTSVYFLSQQYFMDLGLNKIEISLVLLMIGVFSCIGAMFSEKLTATLQGKVKYLGTLCIVCGILGMSIGSLLISLICIGIMSFFNAVLYPLQSASLNRLIPSEQRATIISVNSMAFSLFMIVCFPLMGFVADKCGVQISFLVTGITGLVWLLGMRKMER